MAAVGALMAVALLLAGCGGDDEPAGRDPEPTWPLTGLTGYPEGYDRPVIVVKVDDSAAGRPQVGIGKADLVIQEMVEGGSTRLAAMYQSSLPSKVEPVRSVRLTDIGLVKPTGGTIAASGGETSTIKAVQDAGITLVTEGSDHFSRDSSRSAPYNLTLDVQGLDADLPAGAPTQPYFRFSESGAVPADAVGDPIAAVRLTWPLGGSKWAYDPAARTWQRTDLADDDGFAFTNVVVLTLKVVYKGGQDASGTDIPTMVTEGSGRGVVVSGDRAYPVTWSKATSSDRWSLGYVPHEGFPDSDDLLAEPSSSSASPAPSPVADGFTLPAGRTWLALLPEEGGEIDVTAAEPTPTGSPAP